MLVVGKVLTVCPQRVDTSGFQEMGRAHPQFPLERWSESFDNGQ